MIKAIQDLKRKFRDTIEILKKSQANIQMGLKNSITQLENSRGNLLSRLDQTEDKISGLEDKIEGLDHTNKENEKK